MALWAGPWAGRLHEAGSTCSVHLWSKQAAVFSPAPDRPELSATGIFLHVFLLKEDNQGWLRE